MHDKAKQVHVRGLVEVENEVRSLEIAVGEGDAAELRSWHLPLNLSSTLFQPSFLFTPTSYIVHQLSSAANLRH